MLRTIRKLREQGVVGINARNARYVMPLNKRSLYPLVDDKTKTKELAIEHGLPVPELYAVFSRQGELSGFRDRVQQHGTFVVKPAQGTQGDGITVIEEPTADGWRKIGGEIMTDADMAYYLSNILSGMYSLGGRPDVAMVEYRVRFDPVFEDIAYKGVPDVRVIVYRGVPAFAMLRLPTKESDGKANLHKGGIGAGVDIVTGLTSGGVQHDTVVLNHPDSGASLTGVQVPHWDRILEMSARAAEASGLGYLGADIVLDDSLGPLILELNARPGLAIQVANNIGLAKRYATIDSAIDTLPDPATRTAFAREEFGTT